MPNTVYDNKVLEVKVKDLLTTSLNTRSLMTIDASLAAEAGMKKEVNTYEYDGTVEELGIGDGNSGKGSITFATKEYVVKMNQQRFAYHDEEFMKDPTIVDNMLKGANQKMVNKMTADFIGECGKATLKHTLAGELSYDDIVDAISLLNLEDESKLYIVIPNEWKAALRKDEDYKTARMGEVIYNGQVGTICGIPVIATKALTDEAYVMTNEAIELLMKKDVEVEQERDSNTRENIVYLRTAYLVALVDATKICKVAIGETETDTPETDTPDTPDTPETGDENGEPENGEA